MNGSGIVIKEMVGITFYLVLMCLTGVRGNEIADSLAVDAARSDIE